MNKIEKCKNIQCNIGKLSENEIVELFKIIDDNKTNYTKNNNGVFVNLKWVNDSILTKIENYINFCIKSQNEISKYEVMKNLLNESIKSKDKIQEDKVVEPVEIINQINNKPKFSSSMKFYLLKKKFFKQNICQNNIIDNNLVYEDYIM